VQRRLDERQATVVCADNHGAKLVSGNRCEAGEAVDLYDAADRLDAAIRAHEYDGYGPRPIPHPLDEPVGALLRAVRSAGPTSAEVLGCMTRGLANVLLGYAERAAALAVRRASVEVLELDVFALGLAEPGDLREKLLVMPLPWRSAELLGHDPRSTFERVAAELPNAHRGDLLTFSQRRPADQTLSAMGYSEGADQDGFRYHRDW
jgi:hypothetical protein